MDTVPRIPDIADALGFDFVGVQLDDPGEGDHDPVQPLAKHFGKPIQDQLLWLTAGQGALKTLKEATADQSVADATPTILSGLALIAGTDTGDDTRIVARREGVYLIEAMCACDGDADGSRKLQLKVNGVAVDFAADLRPGIAETQYLRVTAMLQLADDDEVQMEVTQSSGGALDFTARHLAAIFLGAAV
jgi:hypothetical protein